MTLLAIISVLVWLGILATGAWRLREVLEADPGAPARAADVTALIPARNEAEVLADCLREVVPQVGHTIVVDDDSDDTTARVAASVGSVQVVTGSPRPEGWSGKLWALEQGLAGVRTPWMLLLDADISLDAGLVATMRRKTDAEALDMLSLMVALRMRTLVERWLMPPFVYFFRLIYPFRRANDPGSATAAAAGGCILVRTQALHDAGAFESIRDAIIDDCTLARRVKERGCRTWIGLTRSARSLRGYAGVADVWRMVARTAYTQLSYSPVLLLGCAVAMGLAFVAPLVAIASGPPAARLLGAAAVIVMLASFVPLLRFYALSWAWALTLPAAALAYLAMTFGSALDYRRGIRSRWKGRTYRRGVVG